jgi:hypothetical protein
MASQFPPGFYDEAKLSVLEQAFGDVWRTLAMNDAIQAGKRDDDLRAAVVRRLMDLVGEGITDPQELRRRTLIALPLSQHS